MPLLHSRAVSIEHPPPMVGLGGARRVLADDDPSDEVVAALHVVPEHWRATGTGVGVGGEARGRRGTEQEAGTRQRPLVHTSLYGRHRLLAFRTLCVSLNGENSLIPSACRPTGPLFWWHRASCCLTPCQACPASQPLSASAVLSSGKLPSHPRPSNMQLETYVQLPHCLQSSITG